MRKSSEFNPFWTWPTTSPSGIDFDLDLDIADFGLGSDAPILLDYRNSETDPKVIRLRWSGDRGSDNEWVELAPDFESFVLALGL